MNDGERLAWLARCERCTRYKPRKKTLHCELARAVRERNEFATKNIKKFKDEYGFCKQYEPVD